MRDTVREDSSTIRACERGDGLRRYDMPRTTEGCSAQCASRERYRCGESAEERPIDWLDCRKVFRHPLASKRKSAPRYSPDDHPFPLGFWRERCHDRHRKRVRSSHGARPHSPPSLREGVFLLPHEWRYSWRNRREFYLQVLSLSAYNTALLI